LGFPGIERKLCGTDGDRMSCMRGRDYFQIMQRGSRTVSPNARHHLRANQLRHCVGHASAQHNDLGAEEIDDIRQHNTDNLHPASNKFLNSLVAGTDRLAECRALDLSYVRPYRFEKVRRPSFCGEGRRRSCNRKTAREVIEHTVTFGSCEGTERMQ